MRLLPFLILSLGSLTAALSLHAEQEETFEATGLMRAETRWLVNSLERLHFSEMALEDIDMAEVIESFMVNLDFNHLYFREADRESFVTRFAPPMTRYLRSGNIHPAFQVFSVYRTRALDRIAWIRDYLENDFRFDEDLVYRGDREDVEWAADEDELNELWKRRIQYELLNEVLARMSPEEDVEEIDLAFPPNAVQPSQSQEPEGSADETVATESEGEEALSFEEALAEAKELVAKRYDRQETELKRFEPVQVQEMFLTTLANSYDPHSIFLSADSLEDLSIAIENSLVGIGAVLSDEDGYCTIRELIAGGPAELSEQIGVKDQIVGVAQGEEGEFVDVVGMKLRKIVKMIRGEKGSVVRLRIRPGEAADPAARKEVVLVRDEVQLTANLAKARLYQVPNGEEMVSIGVIELPSFYGSDDPNHPNSSDDVAKLIDKLKKHGVEGLILDLRRNGGGLLSEAVELAGLFIPQGPVVQVKTVQGKLLHHDDRDPRVAWNGPLIVLVSKFTASASEIVAGALQNYDRAIVVGDESTHGKGTVQGIFRMSPPLFYSLSSSGEDVGATKVTVQKYYLPNGESTQLEGVKADVVVPSMNELVSVGEDELEHSMPWDTITPVSFGIESDVALELDLVLVNQELIHSLRERSENRVDSLEEFAYLEESIDFFSERREEKAISLNLGDRLKEREKDRMAKLAFDDRLEQLEKSTFSFESIFLETEPFSKDEEQLESENDGQRLDIVLQEGIRIMADWLLQPGSSNDRPGNVGVARADA